MNLVTRFPKVFLLLILGLTFLFAGLLPKIRIQKTIDIFYNKKGETYKKFQQWKKVFGSDDRIIIAWKDKNLFTPKGLYRIKRLSLALEKVPGINKVLSLYTVSDIRASDEDFYVESPLKSIPTKRYDLLKLKKRILSNPIFVGNFISKKGDTTSIILFLDDKEASEKGIIIEKVNEILKDYLTGIPYHLTGSAIIDYYYTKYMENDLRVFLPVILVIIFFILLYTFNNLGGVLFPFITIIVSLIWTMVLLYFFNFALNNVTTIIPPIIMAISIADSIHFVAEILQRHERKGLKIDGHLISKTMRDLLLPCSMTSITTAIGFFSLIVSQIEPIRQMGIVAGIGVLLALFVTFTLLPSLLVLFPIMLEKKLFIKKKLSFINDSFLEKIADLSWRFRYFILGLSILLIIFSLGFTTRIKTETSMINYFKKDTTVYRSTIFVQDNLGGIHFLNLSLRSNDEDYFKNPSVLNKIDKLQRYVDCLPKVDKVTSIVDYIKMMNKAFHDDNPNFYCIPKKRSTVSQYLLLYDADDISDYIDDTWSWANVEVRVSENSSLKIMRLVHKLQNSLERYFPKLKDTSVLGISVLEAETNELVTQSQIRSLSLAFIMIFILMFIVFRSIKIGLLSMIPNIIPLIFNFGLMGLLRINLDSATSMISAVGIGIIVDDTIHFLHTFISFRKVNDFRGAVKKTLLEKGRPIIFTSVILFFGFIVLVLSKFSPTSSFGILTSILMVSALLADILILPSILYVIADYKERRKL